MATYFSDHFSADGSNQTTADLQKRVSAGISHGRVRYKKATVSGAAFTTSDVLRFMQFKSSDRPIEIFLTSTDSGTTGTLDIGLHKSGLAHDGAVIDADLFASAVDVNAAAVARVDQFIESTTLTNFDRGQPLWFLADKGAATLTADPMEDWDLTITPAASCQVATTIQLEVFYTSGD